MSGETSEVLHPGVEITPQITIEECEILLEKLYGLKCKKIVELNAYDDKNYKIVVNDECDNKYIKEICENGYVFKILNSFDSKKVAFIEAQTDMMNFLAKNSIKCPKPVLNKNGESYSIEKLKTDYHVVRLLEFLPGRIFCEITPTDQLFFDAGRYLANLDITLQNFYHIAYKTHRSLWMLESVPEIRQFSYVITNKEDLKMIEAIIVEFESQVLRQIGTLEKGILHGDFNEQNILVRETETEVWTVDSILDFGDTQYSCLLFELAVALTYMILQAKNLSMGGHFLAGYSTVRPIPDHEYKLLKICVTARLCQSLVMGTYSNLQHPDNKYVLSTQASGWTLLRMLWSKNNDELLDEWRLVANKYKRDDKQ